MLKFANTPHQSNFFDANIWDCLDSSDPLIQLANAIDWDRIEDAPSVFYCRDNGCPALPVRLMSGLLILFKQLENLSDEHIVLQFKRNSYYQYFYGMKSFQRNPPCHATELVNFRQRIGADGVAILFQCSVALHGEAAEEITINIDTTLQEKNITYPTNGKLAIQIINRLNKIAKDNDINQRQTLIKEVKELRLKLRLFRHVKKRSSAKKAVKRLRTIASILMRELARKLDNDVLLTYQDDFDLYTKVLSPKPKDSNKIYLSHEPQIYCIAKGNDHKPYEYGLKASIVSTAYGDIILSAMSFAENIHDSKKSNDFLEEAHAVREKPITFSVCDRGYHGVKSVGGVNIILPLKALKRDNRYQRDKKRNRCRQRTAIEPLIGHLKQHYCLSRNSPSGSIGDEINVLMSACAWNMKKWINHYLESIFCVYRILITPIFIVQNRYLAVMRMMCAVKRVILRATCSLRKGVERLT